MKIVSLYTAATATTNAAITYICPAACRLDAIFFTSYIISAAGAVAQESVELSINSTLGINTNDALGMLCAFRTTTIATAAISNYAQNSGLVTPIGYRFAAGDRIYCNLSCTGVQGGSVRNFLLYFN